MLPAIIENKPMSLSDTMQVGKIMAESGFFQDSKGMAQAVVKILAGQELGLPPFAAMTGIHLINGRPSIGANLMAATIKKSGRYDYKVAALTETNCEIVFFERGQEIGRSKFSLDDARKAGTKNLDKFPRNMLFARAISNGVKWFCPDIFGGAPVYTPEELGADVNEDGDIIQGRHTIPEPPSSGGNGNGKKPVTSGEEPGETSLENQVKKAKTLEDFCIAAYQVVKATFKDAPAVQAAYGHMFGEFVAANNTAALEGIKLYSQQVGDGIKKSEAVKAAVHLFKEMTAAEQGGLPIEETDTEHTTGYEEV